MEKNWSIYKITNPEGQVYIGRTSNVKSRLCNYKNLNGRVESQPLLYNSFIKHGYDSHEVEILEENIPDNRAGKSKEIFWIRTYMSNSVKWPQISGLNRTDGGQGSMGLKHSENSKLKTNPPRKGIQPHENQLKVLSLNWTGREKPVAQYSMEGELIAKYPSVKDAQKITGFSSATLSKCLKDGRHYKFIFKYIENV